MKKTARIAVLGLALGLALGARPAHARPEDLKRQIEAQQAAVSDLKRLDEHAALTGEIALLENWLNEAWGQYGKEEYDRVREILDRAVAQAELIRQRTIAVNLGAAATDKENAVKALRDKTARTRDALQQALIRKKAMEMNQK
jgi:hypothetical protein